MNLRIGLAEMATRVKNNKMVTLCKGCTMEMSTFWLLVKPGERQTERKKEREKKERK